LNSGYTRKKKTSPGGFRLVSVYTQAKEHLLYTSNLSIGTSVYIYYSYIFVLTLVVQKGEKYIEIIHIYTQRGIHSVQKTRGRNCLYEPPTSRKSYKGTLLLEIIVWEIRLQFSLELRRFTFVPIM